MGIADFFRPKYRHSDVRVRAEAVRALGSDETSLLVQIARTDHDATVRRIALEKIEEASVLAELRDAESERSLKDFAGERAAELWQSTACSGDAEAAGAALSGILKLGQQDALVEIVSMAELPAIRKRAFGELRDPRALGALAKSDAAQDLRIAAVSRIDDPEVLRALAIDTTQKEVGLAAVEKLDDIERLEQIAHKAKNKAVRAKAQKIVAEIREAERAKQASPATDEAKRRRAERAQLVREVESVADSFDFARASETVTRAQTAWDALGADEPGADDRFATAVSRFWKRKELHEQQARSADELRAIEREAQADKQRAAAERAAAAPREREPDDYVREAAPDPKREAREAEARVRREEREQKRVEDDARRQAQAAERAAKQKEDAERGAAIAQSLAALCGEMEQLVDKLDTRDGKATDRLLQQAGRAFDDIGKVPAAERDLLADRYRAARTKLATKLAEMREAEDWQRWANVPKAEALIETAKEWLAAEATPDLGNRLRQLQALWKEVGPMPQRRSKELWDTFKATCDQVYDKVKGVRAVENEKFADVAKVKEALIAEAEALAESTDWAATAEKLKTLQGQWKQSGHLPRKQGDELWNRFRAACDKFFERRKPLLEAQHQEQAANLARKHALIARAQAVVDGAPGAGGWGKAIGTIKDLQAEWKEIGHVPRRDADAVYRAFRTACDALFAKRDAARDAEANAHHAERDALRAEIAAVVAGGDDVVARALAVRAKAAELGALATEVNDMVRHVVTVHADAVAGTELDPAQLRARRDKLIAKVEELMPKQPAAPAAATGDVAAQLKAAMRQNAFGDLRFSGRDPVEVIDDLRAQWIEIGPELADDDRAQRERFEATITRVLDAHGGTVRRTRREPEVVASAVPVSVHDAITQPAREPLPPPATRGSATEATDAGWDLGTDDPTASAATPPATRISTPSALEMAGDGDTDDGLDNVD